MCQAPCRDCDRAPGPIPRASPEASVKDGPHLGHTQGIGAFPFNELPREFQRKSSVDRPLGNTEICCQPLLQGQGVAGVAGLVPSLWKSCLRMLASPRVLPLKA